MATAVTGQYCTRNGETAWIFVPHSWKRDQSRRGIIACHGALQNASGGSGQSGQLAGQIMAMAAATGCVCVFPDLAGTPGTNAAWGNDSSLTTLASHWATLKSEFNVKPDKMILSGVSMGGATALLALLNPSSLANLGAANIAALELEVPAVNISDIHDNNRLAQQAPIDTAYAANWAGVKAARDPILNMTTFNSLGIPMSIQYASDDPVCLPQFAIQFAANVTNVQLFSQGAVGHSIAGVNLTRRSSFLLQYVS